MYPEGYFYVADEGDAFPALYAIWENDGSQQGEGYPEPVSVDSSGRTTSVFHG